MVFDFASFGDRFWLHFGSPNASLLAPFWSSKSIKKSIRNRTALKVAPRSPQERPRPSQDAPRTPPESPRTPPRGPQMPSRTPFYDPKGFSFSEKSKTSKPVENHSKTKSTSVIHSGHPHRSHKNRKRFQNGRTQRVAAVVARSALTMRKLVPLTCIFLTTSL